MNNHQRRARQRQHLEQPEEVNSKLETLAEAIETGEIELESVTNAVSNVVDEDFTVELSDVRFVVSADGKKLWDVEVHTLLRLLMLDHKAPGEVVTINAPVEITIESDDGLKLLALPPVDLNEEDAADETD